MNWPLLAIVFVVSVAIGAGRVAFKKQRSGSPRERS